MVFVFAGVETNVGIICGCLPGIKPLLNKMFPKAFAAPTESRTFQEFGRRRRLPGTRLSIHPPQRAHFHRPSSGSMIEVPIKLDQHWNPLESPVHVVPFRGIQQQDRFHSDVERRTEAEETHYEPELESHEEELEAQGHPETVVEHHAVPDLEAGTLHQEKPVHGNTATPTQP
jgi:hypothetical protein